MRNYLNYKNIERKAIKKYKTKMHFIHHWEKVEKIFKKNIKKDTFKISLKHDPFSDITYDNEYLLEGIANHYGFNIKDEQLFGNRSVYMFEKI